MATKIRIAARLRPKIQGEVNDEAVSVQNDDTGSFVMVNHPRDQTQRFKFPFSSCYGPNSIQEEIYKNDVKPLLDVVFDGVVGILCHYIVLRCANIIVIDGYRFCIWCDFFREDAHNSGVKDPARNYSSCSPGNLSFSKYVY